MQVVSDMQRVPSGLIRNVFSRKLFGSGVVAIAVASGGFDATFSPAFAEDPEDQQIVVVTADDGEEGKDVSVEVRQAPKLWLGIMLKEVEGDLAKYLGRSGILVDNVVPDSPASKAGIVEGDVLLSTGETEFGNPASLMEVMEAMGEKAAAIELNLLRKGEKKTVEVTPAPRPEMDEIESELSEMHFDLSELKDAEGSIKAVLKKLQTNGDKDMNIFRFGSPSMVFRSDGSADQTVESSSDMEVVIKKDVDGKQMEIKIVRKDGQPATVTVDRGGEIQEYTQENMDEMPEEITVMVKPVLDGKGRKWIVQGEHMLGPEQLDIHVVGPNWRSIERGNIDRELIVRKAQELAEKNLGAAVAERAKAAAEEMRVRVREASKVPGEVQELRAMVDELRKEVESLRATLEKKNP